MTQISGSCYLLQEMTHSFKHKICRTVGYTGWSWFRFSSNAEDTLPSPAQPFVMFLTTADKVLLLQGLAAHMLVSQTSTVPMRDVWLFDPVRAGIRAFVPRQADASGFAATVRRAVLHPAESLDEKVLEIFFRPLQHHSRSCAAYQGRNSQNENHNSRPARMRRGEIANLASNIREK